MSDPAILRYLNDVRKIAVETDARLPDGKVGENILKHLPSCRGEESTRLMPACVSKLSKEGPKDVVVVSEDPFYPLVGDQVLQHNH